MAYKCSVAKYGTLLYRYGGDLFHALTVSLWQQQGHSMDTNTSNIDNLKQVCTQLNTKFHEQSRRMAQDDSNHPHSIEEFNADNFISSLDQDLWEAICLLTQPYEKSKVTHVRTIRRIFAVCMLLFTVNRECSFPLHTLITDTVETCGGSTRLLQLLNRLGVCASIETHKRYVQYRVEMRSTEGPMSGNPTDSFMIASADNLDYIHKYARAYSGKQGLSWHGTTVQIVQPKPQTLIDHPASPETDPPISTIRHTDALPEPQAIPAKRIYSARSPHKNPVLTSPCPKKARRRRTGTEQLGLSTHSIPTICTSEHRVPTIHTRTIVNQPATASTLEIANFLLKKEEETAIDRLKEVCEQYVLLKVASETHTKHLINLQMYYTLSQNISAPEKSNIVYYSVIDEKCDNKETLLSIINDLYSNFIMTGKKTYVILEGDQATYERLQSIKAEYGNDSSWLIPFVGDWHFLKNYQEVLLKVYFDAGLSELAVASKYPPKSIGTNFTRTHLFLLEVWESLFRVLMSFFIAKEAPDSFLDDVSHMINNSPPSESQNSALRNLKDIIEEISEILNKFSTYIKTHTTHNQTLQFWCQFLFDDCLAYIALFLAIRSGNWDLRVAGFKLMAPLFTSFDRPKYSKLIPHHLQEMHRLPTAVLALLKKGGFTVSILGRPCHSIGIDEAHEMCINKECKEFIVRPSGDLMSRTAKFLPIRSKAIKNFEQQVFADKKSPPITQITSLYTSDPECKKHEINVKAQVSKITSDSNSFPITSQTQTDLLQHLFSSKVTTPQQAHDLMNFRQIGQSEYVSIVNYYILRTPSVQPPKHRKSLLTFSERHARQKKGSQIEKERKLQLEYWKKRVSFSVTTGIQDNMSYRQCIELPRAIATVEGKPVKGAKSNTTKWYEKRYHNVTPSVMTTTLPWNPDSVIMEGMFLINITPWSAHKTMGDYAQFLMKQHILLQYKTAKEVHLLFDDPDCQQLSPKYFERLHRDESNLVPSDHSCTEFSSDLMIPPKWRDNVISCRKCKRSLVCFLSSYFIQKIKHRLRPTQRFVTAGGLEGALKNKALAVSNSSEPECDERLSCNAEESDTRIWLHVLHSPGTRKLVLSPDTDVYHIGLPVVNGTNLEVVVRLSPFSALEQRFLSLNVLITSFNTDPDLSGIRSTEIPLIVQTQFISTGCDFISFFNGLGKATFLSTLFEYSHFITSNSTDAPGSISMTTIDSNGILSFLRLVGCAYFKKHKSAFQPSFPTPMSLYNSIPLSGNNYYTRHSEWLSLIRDRIWSRIQYEEDMIPSCDALSRHWKRVCWVSSVWSQATLNVIIYPPLSDYGWKQPQQNILRVDWDSDDNVTEIRERVALVRKGCGCKTGCLTARCKCRKSKHECGPGCKCIGCTNLPAEATGQSASEDTESESVTSSDTSSTTSDLEEQVDQLMADVFGTADIEADEDLNTISNEYEHMD